MCYAYANGYPWIGDDGILYGFVTVGHCACYEFTLDNEITANVQVTNCGSDVDSVTGKRKSCDGGDDSRCHVFDFMVPGGGFGIYNACDNMPCWTIMEESGGVCSESHDTYGCYRYDGLNNGKQVSTVAVEGLIQLQVVVLIRKILVNVKLVVGPRVTRATHQILGVNKKIQIDFKHLFSLFRNK